MVKYGIAEMDYISKKDPVMKELVSRFGYLNMGMKDEKDIFTSLVISIASQMLSNSVADIIVGRLMEKVGKITPENVLSKGGTI